MAGTTIRRVTGLFLGLGLAVSSPGCHDAGEPDDAGPPIADPIADPADERPFGGDPASFDGEADRRVPLHIPPAEDQARQSSDDLAAQGDEWGSNLHEVMRPYRSEIVACLAGADIGSDFSGSIKVNFDVEEDPDRAGRGRASAVELTEPRPELMPFLACVTDIIEAVPFASPGPGGVEVDGFPVLIFR